VGTVQALWLDRAGFTRQDCSPPRGYDSGSDQCVPAVGPCEPNGRLDNYCVDQGDGNFLDDLEGRTRVRIYDSNDPDTFAPHSMQGVAESYSSGNLTIVPNAMEGNVTYNGATGEMILAPYTVRGRVVAYDPDTGVVTLSIVAATGRAGWQDIRRLADLLRQRPSYGFSSDPVTLAADPAVTLTINPAGTWITTATS